VPAALDWINLALYTHINYYYHQGKAPPHNNFTLLYIEGTNYVGRDAIILSWKIWTFQSTPGESKAYYRGSPYL
jgi:hypothetical protein